MCISPLLRQACVSLADSRPTLRVCLSCRSSRQRLLTTAANHQQSSKPHLGGQLLCPAQLAAQADSTEPRGGGVGCGSLQACCGCQLPLSACLAVQVGLSTYDSVGRLTLRVGLRQGDWQRKSPPAACLRQPLDPWRRLRAGPELHGLPRQVVQPEGAHAAVSCLCMAVVGGQQQLCHLLWMLCSL